MLEFGIEGLASSDLVLFVGRARAVSILAEPLPRGMRWWREEEWTGFELRSFRYDLDKSHLTLLDRADWDVLLVDLMSEIYPTLHFGKAVMTGTTTARSYLDPIVARGVGTLRQPRTDWGSCGRALRDLGARIQEIAQGRTVLVHAVSLAETYLREGRRVPFAGQKFISEFNGYLARCHRAITGQTGFPTIGVRKPLVVAGGTHRWDLAPCHYDRSYYVELHRALALALRE